MFAEAARPGAGGRDAEKGAERGGLEKGAKRGSRSCSAGAA
jgi:hypothetical protein